MQKLCTKTIGLIRYYLMRFTRSKIKQMLLESGISKKRMSQIPVIDNMKSSKYLSKENILTLGFDTTYEDFDEPEADGIVLEILRMMARHEIDSFNPPYSKEVAEIALSLGKDGYSIGEIINKTTSESLKLLGERLEGIGSNRALTDFKKIIRRILTDSSGAITAATSMLESICKFALDELGISYRENQLPDLLGKIRRESTLETIFQEGEKSKRVIKAISSLTENLYFLAHEAGDRHGHDEKTPEATTELAELFINCCVTVGNLIINSLGKGTLKAKNKD